MRLTQGGSLLLDIVRFSAAFAVFASHFVQPLYGRVSLVALGHQAVWIFFVLSGFVIRFITVTRIGTARDYTIDRVSRIYSVVAPALVFTLLCELLASVIHPAIYEAIREPFAWSSVPGQFLANLTFTAQCWGYEVNPLSNSPFWSLSFECIYYAMYAVVHYRVRGGWWWAALLLLIAGPSVALLAPVWLLGCVACDVYLKWSRRRNGVALGAALAGATALILILTRHGIGELMHSTDETSRKAWITRVTAGVPFHRALLRQGHIPWLDRFSISAYFVGLLTAAIIILGLLLADRIHPTLPPAVTRCARLLADSTFVLYLFHLPSLFVIAAILRRTSVNRGLEIFLLIAIPLVLIPVGHWLDMLKAVLRSYLRRRFAVPRTASTCAPAE